MAKILKNIKEEIIEINGKILKIDDVVKEVAKTVKIKGKKDFKVLEKFGFEVASKILIMAGSSTKDDEIIAAVIAAAIVAGAASFSGGTGAIPAASLSTATVTPIIKGALAALNPYEIKAGKSLAVKAANM